MARKRISPTPEEINRIVEALFGLAEFKIQDRDSFDLAFNDYMNFTDKEVEAEAEKRKFQKSVFNEYKRQHPEISEERLFSKAGGRDLTRDRLKTAKKVVTTRQEFIEEGAKAVDLKGFDTARQKVTKKILRRRRFTIPSRVRGKVVFALRTSVTVKGKKQLRFRDARGRFTSPKVR